MNDLVFQSERVTEQSSVSTPLSGDEQMECSRLRLSLSSCWPPFSEEVEEEDWKSAPSDSASMMIGRVRIAVFLLNRFRVPFGDPSPLLGSSTWPHPPCETAAVVEVVLPRPSWVCVALVTMGDPPLLQLQDLLQGSEEEVVMTVVESNSEDFSPLATSSETLVLLVLSLPVWALHMLAVDARL